MTKEELEKEIKSLGKRCLQLQKDKGNLIDYNKKLLQENTDQHNKIVLLSKKVNDLQKENAKVEEIKANADYQLEGRDNEIAELKQENKVLAQNLEDTEIVNKALEKENAELKEELKDANKKVVHLACNQNKDLKRKINKAKEIIKNLMVFAEIDCREYEKAYKEAEQFLNSEVEK